MSHFHFGEILQNLIHWLETNLKKINKNPVLAFREETIKRVRRQAKNRKLQNAAFLFLKESAGCNYSYNFTWLGRPIIQYPQDIMAMQEIIWEVKPDLIIETGIAHGGSLIFYASLLELIGKGEVVGVDIDIRAHNRKEIESHPMFKRITLIEGSSVDSNVIRLIKKLTSRKKTVLVALDSNHTHEHVLNELNIYSSFVTKGSYLVVFDTLIEKMPKGFYVNRSWDTGNNPMTALDEFLKSNPYFQIQNLIDSKLLITVSPNGYLKRIK